MTGLLDHIFYNLDERDLDRSQINAYICYLDELIRGGLPIPKEIAYQSLKLQLAKRLITLDQEQIFFQRKDKHNKAS